MRRILLMALATALLVGCGGEKAERVLHLGGGDMTEATLRLEWQAALMEPGSESFCRSLRGLSDKEAAAVIVKAQEGATLTQGADSADRSRAAAIVKEECTRIFGDN